MAAARAPRGEIATVARDSTLPNYGGDVGIALALGHYASRMEVVPMEHQSTGRRRIGAEMRDYLG